MHKEYYRFFTALFLCISAMSTHSGEDNRGVIIDFVPEIAKPYEFPGDYIGSPKCEMEWPSKEEEKKYPGLVVVQLEINVVGRPENILVVNSIPEGKYDRYVLEYLKKCHVSRNRPDDKIEYRFVFGKEL